MKTLLTFLVTGMFLMTPLLADDADDVKAEVRSLFAAMAAQDGDEYYSHHLEGLTSFNPGGGLLGTASLDERKRGIKAAFGAGMIANLQPRHIDVKVYGNAAIVTAYLTGTRAAPGEEGTPTVERTTQVWIKQGNDWKEVHYHASPLVTPASR